MWFFFAFCANFAVICFVFVIKCEKPICRFYPPSFYCPYIFHYYHKNIAELFCLKLLYFELLVVDIFFCLYYNPYTTGTINIGWILPVWAKMRLKRKLRPLWRSFPFPMMQQYRGGDIMTALKTVFLLFAWMKISTLCEILTKYKTFDWQFLFEKKDGISNPREEIPCIDTLYT